MRFSTIIVSAALATLSVAQSSSSANSTSSGSSASSASASLVPSATYTLTPAQSSQATCLANCPANDPNCRAKCIVVNEGDYSQQNRTIECISDCPKGNGTATDNLNFENCQKACIVSATITPASTKETSTATKGSNNGGASATGESGSGGSGSGSGSGSSSGASNNQASKTAGSSGSPTGSAATTSSSGSAADNVHIPIIGAFIGLGSLAVMFGL